MVKASVRFERGDGYWVAERDSIGLVISDPRLRRC
jgi:hypothetical protein